MIICSTQMNLCKATKNKKEKKTVHKPHMYILQSLTQTYTLTYKRQKVVSYRRIMYYGMVFAIYRQQKFPTIHYSKPLQTLTSYRKICMLANCASKVSSHHHYISEIVLGIDLMEHITKNFQCHGHHVSSIVLLYQQL